MNYCPCCVRDLPPTSSGMHCVLSGVFSLFREFSWRIWGLFWKRLWVYEVDPLLCPTCGGRMRIIAFIEEPKVIDKIIRHLKLIFATERPPPPRIVQQELLMAAEEREEYCWGPLLLHFGDLRVESILNSMVCRLRLICFAFLVFDLIVLGVILLFLDISRWKLQKMAKNPWLAKKGNTYKSPTCTSTPFPPNSVFFPCFPRFIGRT